MGPSDRSPTSRRRRFAPPFLFGRQGFDDAQFVAGSDDALKEGVGAGNERGSRGVERAVDGEDAAEGRDRVGGAGSGEGVGEVG